MKKLKNILFGFVFGVLCLVAATAVALGAIHVTELPYRTDINALGICEASGFDYDTVLRNYRDAMRFLSPFRSAPFTLSDLNVSPGGAQHFEETKIIFTAVYIAGFASILIIAVILLVRRRKDKRFLLASSITTLTVPALVGLVVAIDFDAMFLLFHEIFFDNDLWIFDPRKDEIIKILPAEFFMHCALVIAAFWITAAVAQFIVFRKAKKLH